MIVDSHRRSQYTLHLQGRYYTLLYIPMIIHHNPLNPSHRPLLHGKHNTASNLALAKVVVDAERSELVQRRHTARNP